MKSSTTLPSIAEYIKNFTFHYYEGALPNVTHLQASLKDTFKFIRGQDYGIEELSLFAFGDWDACTADLQQAFDELLRSPYLRSLRVGDINKIPVRSLVLGSHLKKLLLSTRVQDRFLASTLKEEATQPRQEHTQPKLRSLELFGVSIQ